MPPYTVNECALPMKDKGKIETKLFLMNPEATLPENFLHDDLLRRKMQLLLFDRGWPKQGFCPLKGLR